MTNREVAERLEAHSPPELDQARERAKLAARVALSAQPPHRGRAASAGAANSSPFVGLVPRGALAAMLCLLLMGVFATLTSPGRAAATWLGQQVGIGEPGGEPTLHDLRDSWGAGAQHEESPAVVIARGPTPYGGEYELLTYLKEGGAGGAARCFELDLLPQRNGFSAGCERLPGSHSLPLQPRLPERAGLQITSAGQNLDSDHELRFVQGRVTEDIAAVEVEFHGEPVQAELNSPPPALLNELGIAPHFRVFVAFLPLTSSGGPIWVTARTVAGEAVAHDSANLASSTFD